MKNSNYITCFLFFITGVGLYWASAATWAAWETRSPIGELGQSEADGIAAERPVNPDDRAKASPDLTPVDVVVLQVESLQETVDDPEQIETCYGLAAPRNRSAIGSLERFAAIAMSPEYDGLIYASRWLVGEPVVHDGIAMVTVTTVTTQGNQESLPLVWGYRFILEQQTERPYKGCWMTLAVENLTPNNVGKRAASNTEGQVEI